MGNNVPLRIVALLSGSGSSLRGLYKEDPNYGELYTFVGVISDKPDVAGITFASKESIPTRILDFKDWCRRHKVGYRNTNRRGPYFKIVLEAVRQWKPDVIILSGFMLKVTEPLLDAFEGRILNVHPALLSILDENGKRKYTGNNVVARAMANGDPTGSTIHVVTEETDMGPIVFEQEAPPYADGDDPEDHQELMKTECDVPAYMAALKLLIDGGWPRCRFPWEPTT